MADKYPQLLEYVEANGRSCLQPIRWNILWEMLPNRRRAGNGWEQAPRLSSRHGGTLPDS